MRYYNMFIALIINTYMMNFVVGRIIKSKNINYKPKYEYLYQQYYKNNVFLLVTLCLDYIYIIYILLKNNK